MALNLPGELAAAIPGKDWKLTPVTRPASSAPAVGSAKVHEAQQRELLDAAFA
jgi:2-oxoglutarate dehydrogenase E1 component